jgi:hypothetical protein
MEVHRLTRANKLLRQEICALRVHLSAAQDTVEDQLETVLEAVDENRDLLNENADLRLDLNAAKARERHLQCLLNMPVPRAAGVARSRSPSPPRARRSRSRSPRHRADNRSPSPAPRSPESVCYSPSSCYSPTPESENPNPLRRANATLTEAGTRAHPIEVDEEETASDDFAEDAG